MSSKLFRAGLVVAVIAAGCASLATLRSPSGETIKVPRAVAGSLEPVAPGDRSYAAADPAGATPGPGNGGVVKPYVVRLTGNLPVYRLFDGSSEDRRGRWWTFAAPTGTRTSFRERYEVCEIWSTLRVVATCTLQKGAVVVIGPGQSVSQTVCKKAGENYPANDQDLQVFVKDARTSADLICPDASQDYENDPKDISKHAAAP